MTVEPGTAARAAAFTLAAVVPVRSVSPGPWLTVAGFGAAADGWVLLEVDDEDEFVAAPAMPAAPRTTPAAAAAVMTHARAR